MKLSELLSLCELFERIANNGEKITDFGVDDESKSVYACIGNGIYEYFLTEEKENT